MQGEACQRGEGCEYNQYAKSLAARPMYGFN